MSIVPPGRVRVAATLLAGLVAATPCFGEPLSLAQVTSLALTHNLEAEQARGDVLAADADVKGARSEFMPHVNTSAAWTKPEEGIGVDQGGQVKFFGQSWSARINANLTVFDGFGNVHGYEAASRSRAAARDRYDQARQNVVYETERRFFEVRRQEALLQVQKEAVNLSAEQLKRTSAMKELGAATQADVYKAEVDRSNSELA